MCGMPPLGWSGVAKSRSSGISGATSCARELVCCGEERDEFESEADDFTLLTMTRRVKRIQKYRPFTIYHLVSKHSSYNGCNTQICWKNSRFSLFNKYALCKAPYTAVSAVFCLQV